MNTLWRKLDNTAKIFSLENKNTNNTFRLSVILKEKINVSTLKKALIKTLNTYPNYKVKIKEGFFWNYFEVNAKDLIIEEEKEMPCKSINLNTNNGYLFKVTYFNNKINLDIFHALTDGVGATFFLKSIIYNYLNLEYKIYANTKKYLPHIKKIQDEYLKNVNKKVLCTKKNNKAYQIKEKINIKTNKTYHYIFELDKTKTICKQHNMTITEYLTAIYLYAIYNSIYNNKSKKDINITIPIDLRKHYQVESLSNFFTCAYIKGNIKNNKQLTFKNILAQVHEEFKNKINKESINKYLARDVKLGTNIAIRLVPLSIKKIFISSMNKIINRNTTTTLSNIGPINIEKKYQKYIDNIIALVNTGKVQKVKCTICSYQNNLTITLNSNLITDKLEKEFSKLLSKYLGKFRLETNII